MIAELKKEFPNIQIAPLQGGCNVYTDNQILTFWFKKKKWCSSKTQAWDYFTDTQSVLDIIHKCCQPRKVKKSTPVVKEIPEDKGTQKCIDHILAKADRIGVVKGEGNAIAMMLKTVAGELKQFL